ncbi:MAG: cyanophycinase [Verrucomicrobiota bacterium]
MRICFSWPLAWLAIASTLSAAPEHPTELPKVRVLFAGGKGDPAVRHFTQPKGEIQSAAVYGEGIPEAFAKSFGFRLENRFVDAADPLPGIDAIFVSPPTAAKRGRILLEETARELTSRGLDVVVHPTCAEWIADALYPTARIVTGSAAATAQPMPGKLTICIPDGSALHFRGSEITAIGHAPVRFLLATSARRKAKTVSLKHFASHDYILLARAVRERAKGSPNPPAKTANPELKNGALVLAGGNKSPRSALEWMLQRAGGPERARLVIIPTARPESKLKLDQVFETFRGIGFRKISIAHSRRDVGNETSASRQIDSANAIWITGGRQWRLVDAFENGPALGAMHRLLERGGVIGGSSAGATICGEYLVRGDPRAGNIFSAEGYERAFNFLPGVAIDQHFTERDRAEDLEKFITNHPQFTGIGIDETTAIIVEGSSFFVRGLGGVTVTTGDESGNVESVRLKAHESYDFAVSKSPD